MRKRQKPPDLSELNRNNVADTCGSIESPSRICTALGQDLREELVNLAPPTRPTGLPDAIQADYRNDQAFLLRTQLLPARYGGLRRSVGRVERPGERKVAAVLRGRVVAPRVIGYRRRFTIGVKHRVKLEHPSAVVLTFQPQSTAFARCITTEVHSVILRVHADSVTEGWRFGSTREKRKRSIKPDPPTPFALISIPQALSRCAGASCGLVLNYTAPPHSVC